MCIITKVSETDVVGYRCACDIGWALANDLKSCISKRDKKFSSRRSVVDEAKSNVLVCFIFFFFLSLVIAIIILIAGWDSEDFGR